MILIYTQKISPRITYAFHQVLGRVLGHKVKFTSKVEEFIAHDDLKLSYGKQQMGNEFFVKAAGLLNEQGVSELDISVKKWGGVPCFFKVGKDSDIPFDIFSASFYMLSRYEEYLPYVKDGKGRYPVEESLAFKKDFLQQPVVDLWAYKFKSLFQRHFPESEFPKRPFKAKNILAITQAFRYRKKGIMRNIGGGFQDLTHLELKSFFERIQTLLHFTKDPYDIYEELLRYSKQRHIDWQFMFQLSDYSIHNKNIGYNNMSYRILMKSLGDYGKIGLLVGYEALSDIQILKKEKKRWENILNRDVESAMSNYYGLNLPRLYNNYDTLEIGNDYSMGFVEKIGFRAGTCTPFLYYDLDLERISPLVLHPTVFNSASFKSSSFFEVKVSLERIKKIVKSVDGNLLMVYNNYDFSEGRSGDKFFQLLELMNEE